MSLDPVKNCPSLESFKVTKEYKIFVFEEDLLKHGSRVLKLERSREELEYYVSILVLTIKADSILNIMLDGTTSLARQY